MMKVTPPPVEPPSLKQLFCRKCFLLGITGAEKVERLWKEEAERRKVATAEAKSKKPKRKQGE
jgi:hypothetical protein